MKKSLLLKSGCVVAAFVVSATSALGAAGYEGEMYERFREPSQELRGAMGPIRSDEAIKTETPARYEGDMYERFYLPSQELRGVMGPIRSDEPSQEDSFWKDLQQRAPVLGGGNG